MLNKRFLGLGFSFTANDRGLEKKLMSIKSAMDGIAASMKTVNDIGGSAKFSGFKKATPEKTRVGQRSAKPTSSKVDFQQHQPEMFKDIFCESIVAEKVSLGKGASVFSGLVEGLGKDRVKRRQVGEKGITNLDEVRFVKSLGRAIKFWSQETSHAFSRFADSIGFRIRDLIPDQIAAAFGLIKAAFLKPLWSGTKKLLGFGSGKTVDRIFTLMKKIYGSLSSERDSIQKNTARTATNTKTKKEQGFFGKLFGKVGGFFSKLFSPIKTALIVASSFMLGQLKKVVSTRLIAGVGKAIIRIFTGGKILVAIKSSLVAGAVAVIAAFSSGFIKTFTERFAEIKSSISLIFSSLWGILKTSFMRAFDSLPLVVKIAAVSFKDRLVSVFDQIWESLVYFSIKIEKALFSVVDWISNIDFVSGAKKAFSSVQWLGDKTAAVMADSLAVAGKTLSLVNQQNEIERKKKQDQAKRNAEAANKAIMNQKSEEKINRLQVVPAPRRDESASNSMSSEGMDNLLSALLNQIELQKQQLSHLRQISLKEFAPNLKVNVAGQDSMRQFQLAAARQGS